MTSLRASPQVYSLFFAEVTRHLARAAQEIRPGAQALNDNSVADLRRTFHTMKGGAGFLGFDGLASKAGSVEDILKQGLHAVEKNLDLVKQLLAEIDEIAEKLPNHHNE